MKFDTPVSTNPIDRLAVVGRPLDRIEGPLKTTGTAPYAYEHDAIVPDAAYGFVIPAPIAKGRLDAIDVSAARVAPGVLAVVTAADIGPLGKGHLNTATLLGGPKIEHYNQALGVVVARSFEQARAAAFLVRIDCTPEPGAFSLPDAAPNAPLAPSDKSTPSHTATGDFAAAFAAAPVRLDARYTTPDQSHAMMEPHATTASWTGDRLTIWTSNQMIAWDRRDLAATLKISEAKVRVVSPFVGGGFGAKLFLRADALLAALGARAAGCPVKLALTRPLIFNNTTHRPATIQRIRIGATPDGRITAIGHESWSGDLPDGGPETATSATRKLYAGSNRMTAMHLAVLDLPEGNAMRAPGEAPGLMALEIAMDEMAEKLRLDPIEFRIRNDTQVVPEEPDRRFSRRHLVECLRTGAERFGWSRRNPVPGQVRDGEWLVGQGVASAFRDSLDRPSAARVHLLRDGSAIVETDMTDIGTGSYTILAQTASEMLGVPMHAITVRLGDSDFPVSSGSGGQWGAANSTAGVYAACMKLRAMVASRIGVDPDTSLFADGSVHGGARTVPLATALGGADLVAEDGIEYGDLSKRFQLSTFGAHFVEVGVNRYSGETRVRRMLAVCEAGRILNPRTARSQVIGAMTMGVGGALSEALAVDPHRGFFANHDLAGYEVAVHADIPHQEVVFLDIPDPLASPTQAKGVGELGLCGVAAAIANAAYNATGIRIRDYPITLDKMLDRLQPV